MSLLRRTEDALLALALAAMALLPVLEVMLRAGWRSGLASGAAILQHMTLVVAMLGAAVAAREGRLIVLSNAPAALTGSARTWIGALGALATTLVAALMAVASWIFLRTEWEAGRIWFGTVPAWMVQWVMPAGFALIAWRALHSASTTAGVRAAVMGVAVALVALYSWQPFDRMNMMVAGLVLLGGAALAGGAVFAVLGGAAMLLFWGQDLPIASLAVDHYRLVVNPALPAIPLFTLAGFLLAEGGAPARLLAVFEALFGLRGSGVALVTVAVCAFFTAFTGASGVTILTLGPLLLPLLVSAGHSRRSALGLATSAGALGVLLPPSLPLILYGVVAKVPLQELFVRAVPPALMMMALVLGYAMWSSRRAPALPPRPRPDLRASLRAARWELLLPVLAFAAIFGGWATPVEAAALTVVYAFVIEVFVYRGISLGPDLRRVVAQSGLLVGGVLLILGLALGLTNYLADAQVPDHLVEWARQSIGSRGAFLLALNAVLLLVGCLMDVFSATVVLVPLLLPLAAAFGVDPIHLGIIFLANMELGLLTPPVGMNLFFAAQRFGVPLGEAVRACLPYVLVMGAGVLLITYLPWLSGA